MASQSIDSIFAEFSDQNWDMQSKWLLLTRFLEANPNPKDRSNENLYKFLLEQFDAENGFSDDDDVADDSFDDISLK